MRNEITLCMLPPKVSFEEVIRNDAPSNLGQDRERLENTKTRATKLPCGLDVKEYSLLVTDAAMLRISA